MKSSSRDALRWVFMALVAGFLFAGLADAAWAQAAIRNVDAQVVDSQKALQDPNVSIVEAKIEGSDPLTAAASAYATLRARPLVLKFKHEIDLHKALNGKYPSIDEFIKLMRDNSIEFNPMPPYRMYGYNEKTGGIVVLEKKAEKARHDKEAGIPLDEGGSK